ncbi:MAG: AAA family ATPase [Planctomycetota bacterium]|nr:MAG: AAA family ATPase [Planctomycetota bacterium]
MRPREVQHTESNEENIRKFQEDFNKVKAEIEKHVIGQKSVIEKVLYAVFLGKNVLLEGLPGLGKTTLAKAISRSLDLETKRIQFTPDLMPADITGTNIIEQKPGGGISIEFNEGPIFTSICLADEINRATPKTQSAMLEAMQEKRVTIAGETKRLSDTFCVIATQNPIELEGTYPLPEAQLDRFIFKIIIEETSLEDLIAICDLTTSDYKPKIVPIINEQQLLDYRSNILSIMVPEYLKNYAARIVRATHPNNEDAPPSVKKYVNFGSSPRGLQSLIMAAKVSAASKGEISVSDENIKEVLFSSLRHRIILNFEGEAKQIDSDDLIRDILKTIIIIPESEFK